MQLCIDICTTYTYGYLVYKSLHTHVRTYTHTNARILTVLHLMVSTVLDVLRLTSSTNPWVVGVLGYLLINIHKLPDLLTLQP